MSEDNDPRVSETALPDSAAEAYPISNEPRRDDDLIDNIILAEPESAEFEDAAAMPKAARSEDIEPIIDEEHRDAAVQERREYWDWVRENESVEDRQADRSHELKFRRWTRQCGERASGAAANSEDPNNNCSEESDVEVVAPEWPGYVPRRSMPPFHVAGCDYALPNYEAAVLRLLLSNSVNVEELLKGLSPAHFFDEHNLMLFGCILRLHNEGQKLRPSTALRYLKEIKISKIRLWKEYLRGINRMVVNLEHAQQYKQALEAALKIRDGGSSTLHYYDEAIYAELVRSRVGLVRCAGKQWFAYGDGRWQETSADVYRKLARACLHPHHRKQRRIVEVLGQVESALQTPRSDLFGAYKQVEEQLLINVGNGVLEVREGGQVVQRPHRPEDGFTLQIPTIYDPAATCPLFRGLLKEALPDLADRELFQCFAGYILMPSCAHEVCLVCFGPGGTGKSTAAESISYVLGDDVCSHVGLEGLCAGGYSVARLAQKLLNLGSELRAGEIAESSVFKALISGESLEVRQIYCAPQTMRTTVKLMFLSNNMPRFRSGSDAELRRLRFLHFNRKPAKVDLELKSKLRAEAPGIMNWMLEGVARLNAAETMPHGGRESRQVVQSFAIGNDPVGRFFEECCEVGRGGEINKEVLYKGFAEWCQSNGIVMGETWNSYFYRTVRDRYPQLKYIRRRFAGARKDDDAEKRRMVVGVRMKKQLKDQSVSEAIEMHKDLLGHRAWACELADAP